MVRQNTYFPIFLTAPVVIALFALLLYPTLYTFYIAFHNPDSSQLFSFSARMFLDLLGQADFWNNVVVTLAFTVLSTLISFLLGLSIAYAMEFVRGGKDFFLSVFIIPLAIMPAASSLIWRTIVEPTSGIANHLLSFIGIHNFPWATDSSTALMTVILVDVWQWTPFCFLILHAGFRSLPPDVHEAATIDGARPLRELWDISLPLLTNVLIITAIFRFMEAFKAFDSIYILTQGGPGTSTETLVLRAYKEAFQFYRPAITSVIGLWLLIFTILCTRYAGDRIAKGDKE